MRINAALQERIEHDVQAAPGRLPLLEYALTELWKKWHQKYQADSVIELELTLDHYEAIGGVLGALEKQADTVYERFATDSRKQGLVERIFLELVQPGVDTEDTRRRVRKEELASDIHPETLVDEVLASLVASRLIVTDVIRIGANDTPITEVEAMIDLAHEALIRHWGRLKDWLQEHRRNLPLIRQLREQAKHWSPEQVGDSKYFLRGVRLEEAHTCLAKYGSLGYFDGHTQEFIESSQQSWIAEETEKEEQILESLCMKADIQWNEHKELESLISVTRAGKRLQHILQNRPELKPQNSLQVLAKLQETLCGRIQEINRLGNHSDNTNAVAYSPTDKIIASASNDKTIKLWNAQNGRLLSTLEGHNASVRRLAYSPDGKILASTGQDEIRLFRI